MRSWATARKEDDYRCNNLGKFQLNLLRRQGRAKADDASDGKKAVSSAFMTYLEEFGDPTKLEDEGAVPFGEVS